jgi:GPI mannosyltransferase 4
MVLFRGNISCKRADIRTFVIAPLSATPLDVAVISSVEEGHNGSESRWRLLPVRKFRYHINLDDIDLTEESLLGTIARVFGRHGLGTWLLVSV